MQDNNTISTFSPADIFNPEMVARIATIAEEIVEANADGVGDVEMIAARLGWFEPIPEMSTHAQGELKKKDSAAFAEWAEKNSRNKLNTSVIRLLFRVGHPACGDLEYVAGTTSAVMRKSDESRPKRGAAAKTLDMALLNQAVELLEANCESGKNKAMKEKDLMICFWKNGLLGPEDFNDWERDIRALKEAGSFKQKGWVVAKGPNGGFIREAEQLAREAAKKNKDGKNSTASSTPAPAATPAVAATTPADLTPIEPIVSVDSLDDSVAEMPEVFDTSFDPEELEAAAAAE